MIYFAACNCKIVAVKHTCDRTTGLADSKQALYANGLDSLAKNILNLDLAAKPVIFISVQNHLGAIFILRSLRIIGLE